MPVRLYDAGVSCGFPSQDYLEQRLSLDEICIRHPESTYLAQWERSCDLTTFDFDPRSQTVRYVHSSPKMGVRIPKISDILCC
jgi:hypothetical protein|nr:DNA polymerase V [Serratia proteamaculans]